jgi:tRNA threonylcarbamoyl adenosine modification protein YeaZ
MIVLALDTTTRAGRVAVAKDGRVLDLLAGDPNRPHAERLPADLVRSLERAGAALGDVDVFAVAIGPGSFTGLRIGIAAIQGCAFASGRPVVGVSALEALALAVSAAGSLGTDRRLGVWMDAQREEVFSALYVVTGEGPGASSLHQCGVRAISRDACRAARGTQLHVSAVGLHQPGVALVGQLHLEHFPDPLAQVTHLDRRHGLDAP